MICNHKTTADWKGVLQWYMGMYGFRQRSRMSQDKFKRCCRKESKKKTSILIDKAERISKEKGIALYHIGTVNNADGDLLYTFLGTFRGCDARLDYNTAAKRTLPPGRSTNSSSSMQSSQLPGEPRIMKGTLYSAHCRQASISAERWAVTADWI